MSASPAPNDLRARIAQALDDAEWPSIAEDVREGVDLNTVIQRVKHAMDPEEASRPIAIIEQLQSTLEQSHTAGTPPANPAAGCTIAPFGGPQVAVHYMPGCDQWEVAINTQEMDAPSGETRPALQITLNATTLYDRECAQAERGDQ